MKTIRFVSMADEVDGWVIWSCWRLQCVAGRDARQLMKQLMEQKEHNSMYIVWNE